MSAEAPEIIKNVRYVTMSAMNRLGAPLIDYAWFEQIGIEWLSEVANGTTSLPMFRVKHIEVPATKQINLPKDCLRYTKIACEHRNTLYTLTLDDNIAMPPEMDYSSLSNVQINTAPNGEAVQGVLFAPHWWNNNYYDALFGIGGGFNDAYYRVDWASRTLTFNGNFSTNKVVIEYLSDGSDLTGDSLVPTLWIEAMRNYIFWMTQKFRQKEYQFGSNVEADYFSSLIEAQIANGPTMDEMMDAYYKGCGFKLR